MGDFQEFRPILCACGDHAFVAVTQGLTTMVSPEDVALLALRRWRAEPHGGRHRVRGEIRQSDGVRRRVNLGRAVLGIAPPLVPDHINSDPLDNRRSNLRPATQKENLRNKRPSRSHLPKGVQPYGRLYRAEIYPGGKTIRLGVYRTVEDAHAAYAKAALERFGEFARLA